MNFNFKKLTIYLLSSICAINFLPCASAMYSGSSKVLSSTPRTSCGNTNYRNGPIDSSQI